MYCGVLSALATILIASPALGSSGERSGMDETTLWFIDDRGNKFTIYRNLVEDRGSGVVRAWVNSDLPKATKSTSGMVKSLKSQREYDCQRRTERTLYIGAYDSSGGSLGGDEVSMSAKAIVPGTVGELEFAAICKMAGYETKNSFDRE